MSLKAESHAVAVVQGLIDEAEQLKKDKENLASELSKANDKHMKLVIENSSLQNKVSSLEARIRTHEANPLNARVAELREELRTASESAQVNRLKRRLKDSETRVSELQSSLAKAEERPAIQVENDRLAAENQLLKDDLSRCMGQISALNDKMARQSEAHKSSIGIVELSLQASVAYNEILMRELEHKGIPIPTQPEIPEGKRKQD